MKIVEHTPERLVISQRAWASTLILAMFFFALLYASLIEPAGAGIIARIVFFVAAFAGLYLANRFMPFRTIVFDRAAGLMTTYETRLTGRSQSALPLTKISDIRLANGIGDYSGLSTLSLRIEGDWVPLHWGASSTNKTAAFDALKTWLNVPGDLD